MPQRKKDYKLINCKIEREIAERLEKFTEETGLNRLVAAILEVPMNSDEYDEFQIMKQLFAFYEREWGFFKVHVDAPTDTDTAKAFLKQLRIYGRKLTFPTTIYNSGQIEDVPVFVKQNELVVFITPEVEASVDVDALAVLFHMEKAEMRERIIVLDEFPIPNVQAILTTSDFFMCKDTEYQTTSIYNPKTLGQNYFLHHWGIYSVSPFVPAIMFTTGDGTQVPTVTQALTAISATLSDSTPAAGDDVDITVTLTGTLTTSSGSVPDAIKLAPNACTYDVAVTRSGDPVNSPRTRVDEYGVLHVAKTLEVGDVITINITSTYINPSGATTALTTTATATVA